MKNPKVFIIILHFGNPKNTEECLKSLESLEYDNFETVVIDNTKENRGFAGGNNIGIKQALEKGADYILFLNNDTVVEPSFLKELVKAGESNKKIGILGPIGGKINWLYTKGIHVTHNMKHITKETDYITGACMLIKRKVIEKIGLMDEDYFLYCEDVDLCLRAQKAGFLCGVASDSRISHKVSKNAKIASFSYIYYHTRNGLLLAKRNAPVFIKILAYLNSFLVYGKQIIKLAIFPQKRLWARAIMKGIGDFYRGKLGKLT